MKTVIHQQLPQGIMKDKLFSCSSKNVDNNFSFTWQQFDVFVVFIQKETNLIKIITQTLGVLQ